MRVYQWGRGGMVTRSWRAAISWTVGGVGVANKVAAALCTGKRKQATLRLNTHAEITATSQSGESLTSQSAGMTQPSMRIELHAEHGPGL